MYSKHKAMVYKNRKPTYNGQQIDK